MTDLARLVFAFLADYALAHPDGRLYVVGGSFNKLFAPEFPFDYPHLSLVMLLEFPVEMMGQQVSLLVDLADTHGTSLATAEFEVAVPDFDPSLLQSGELPQVHGVVNQQQISFPAPGEYRFGMFLGGRRLGSLPLWLVGVSQFEIPLG